MKKIETHLINNIISLLFTLLGVEILFYSVLREFKLGHSIVIAVLTVLLFIVFGKIVELGKTGPILYMIIATVFSLPSFFLIKQATPSASVGFLSWAKSGGLNIGDYTGYIIAALLLLTFIFTSLSYYFSVTIVRMPMMILLHFIVIILYLKGIYTKDNIFPLVLVILVFALLLKDKKSQKEEKIHNDIKIKHLLVTVSGFIFVIFLIGYLIPKSVRIPIIAPLESMKGYLLGYIADENIKNTDEYIVRSSKSRETNKSNNQKSNRLLYTFNGLNPQYLIDHSFDLYTKGQWIQSDKNKSRSSNNEYNSQYNELNDTIEILNNVSFDSDDLNSAKDLKKNGIERYTIDIELQNFLTNQLVHPSKSRSGIFKGVEDFEVDINQYNELTYTNNDFFGVNYKYTLQYDSDIPIKGTQEELLMRILTYDKYKEIYDKGMLIIINRNLSNIEGLDTDTINKQSLVDSIKEGRFEYLDEIYEEYTYLENNTSSKLKELGVELTKGKESNYDKAKVLEDYFRKGDFVYNLELPEQEGDGDYIDYFIFEGKEGYCVQYATAMTLLCRASGIPARYTEGYLVQEDNYVKGSYQVAESQGHAFVEVYIPGYGWKIFDPTPSILSEDKEVEIVKSSDKKSEIDYKKILLIGGYSILSIAAVVVIVLMILKITKRPRFLRKVKKYSKEERYEALILDCIKLLEDLNLSPYSGETVLNFAIRVDRSLQVGFKEVIEKYYDYKYAGHEVTAKDIDDVLAINKLIYKQSK